MLDTPAFWLTSSLTVLLAVGDYRDFCFIPPLFHASSSLRIAARSVRAVSLVY